MGLSPLLSSWGVRLLQTQRNTIDPQYMVAGTNLLKEVHRFAQEVFDATV